MSEGLAARLWLGLTERAARFWDWLLLPVFLLSASAGVRGGFSPATVTGAASALEVVAVMILLRGLDRALSARLRRPTMLRRITRWAQRIAKGGRTVSMLGVSPGISATSSGRVTLGGGWSALERAKTQAEQIAALERIAGELRDKLSAVDKASQERFRKLVGKLDKLRADTEKRVRKLEEALDQVTAGDYEWEWIALSWVAVAAALQVVPVGWLEVVLPAPLVLAGAIAIGRTIVWVAYLPAPDMEGSD